ncbi:MAG: glycosyltransferase [Pyrinomonadaceae bacterium MAG19_C2-C3]|nr:glycosyltransferase [Pyrinomonadaceae bacterium MAG19_C2-C3]
MKNEQPPLISVIIPCYNQAHYLPESVQSVLAQTHADWECIIVNDGSTDNTKEVALALAGGETRIRYIEQSNRGLSGARNKGVAEAKGQYIQFLDADDLITPRKFEIQLQVLSEINEPSVSYSDYYCSADDVTVVLHKHFPRTRLDSANPLRDMALNWETELSIPVHCFLFDVRLFQHHNVQFDDTLPNHEDWDCWMRLFALRPKTFYVDCEMAIYRVSDNTMCRNDRRMRAGFLAAIQKQIKLYSHDREMKKVLNKKLSITKWAYKGHAPPLSRFWWNIYTALHSYAHRVIPKSALSRLNILLRRY